MSDSRSNRGPHPKDAELFAPNQIAGIRSALHDFAWLLSRGYACNSPLKLVGDRDQFRARQRISLNRAACGDQEVDQEVDQELWMIDLAEAGI